MFTADYLKRVGWTAIQAFLGALIVLMPGMLSAPNMEEAKAVASAALAAAIAAVISAVKNAIAPAAIK